MNLHSSWLTRIWQEDELSESDIPDFAKMMWELVGHGPFYWRSNVGILYLVPSCQAKAAKLYDTSLAISSTDGKLSNLIIVSYDFSATFQLTKFYWGTTRYGRQINLSRMQDYRLKSLILKLRKIRFIKLKSFVIWKAFTQRLSLKFHQAVRKISISGHE